jgi:hypothetical protein
MAESQDMTMPKDELKLKGPSLLVVFYRPRTSTKQLLDLSETHNILRVRKGLFLVRGKPREVRQALSEIPHIALRRTKEIPRSKTRRTEAALHRSFALVAYRMKTTSPQFKKAVQRLVARTFSIRLRPGVFLFPHLRSKDLKKQTNVKGAQSLLNSRQFSQALEEMGAKVFRWTRLQVTDATDPVTITSLIQERMDFEIDTLSSRVKKLRRMAKDPLSESSRLKKRYVECSKQFTQTRMRAEAIEIIWYLDLGPRVRQLYNQLLSTRRIIQER